jgi:hypothetical protein
MKIVGSVLVTWLGALAGCTGESSSPVVGRFSTTCHQALGDIDIPGDLSQRLIQALIPDGSATGYRVLSGSGSADGTFVINDVPDGVTYMLQLSKAQGPPFLGARFYVTDQHVLELDAEAAGRCSPRPATGSAPAIVNIDLANMTTFDTRLDHMELDSFAVGYRIEIPFGSNYANAFSGSVQWPQGAPLVDAAAGDDLQILHVRSEHDTDRTTGRSRTFTHVLDRFDARGKSLQVGAATTISGEFPPASPGRTGTLSIDHDRFNAGYDPTSTPLSTSVQVVAHPWSSFAGTFRGQSPVVAGFTLSEDGVSGISAGTSTTRYTYADPFPASWRRYLSIEYLRIHYVRLSSTHPHISAVGGYQQRIDDPAAIEAEPRLQPPTGITIAGSDFALGGKIPFDGQSPVVIRWDPVPLAQVYRLSLLHSMGDSAAGSDFVTDSVTTSGTSLTLPAAMFASGTIYQFTLAAIQTPTDYDAGQLVLTFAPQVTATALSGRFRFTASCGDGIVQPGEDCDTAGESATCNVDCTTSLCHDGLRNAAAGEACDYSTGCNADCTLRSTP